MNEEYKCIICGKEKKTLISVHTNLDANEIFLRHRGICQKCLNEDDIDIEKFCDDFIRKKFDEQIQHSKDQLEYFEDEKKKLSKKT